MPDPRPVLPLTPDALAQWRGAIDKSREAKKTQQPWADANLRAYAPAVTDAPDSYGTRVNTNRDFTLVERKKADLFYQRPDVTIIPSPLMVGQEAILDSHTTILNEHLGLDGVHAKRLVHQVLFDVICPSGTGWTKMGYESTTITTQTEDPNFQPPVDPMTGQPDPTAQAPMVDVPVPIYEQCFWEWFSPKQKLAPYDAHTTIVDDWPWVGLEFEMPLRAAKRKGWVPDDFTGSAPSQDLHFDRGVGMSGGEAVVRGCELFYKSALYRDDRVHPLHQTQLVLIEGVDAPAEHRDSPYQTLDPQGKLTPDSLIGFPIHPLTIRTLTDSPDVPSDCTISRPLVNELNTFREQMIQFRDAAVLRWMYNVDTLPPDALNKIVRSPVGGFIGVPSDAFVGDGAIKELPHGSLPRENFQINDYLDNDLARTHALDSNQQGAMTEGSTTATEASIQQANVNTRLGLERGVVLDWYLQGVTKYSTLLQRYLPVERAAQIVGPPAAQAWDQWRRTMGSALAFTALPNAAMRMDLASEQKRRMENYSYWANDPMINRTELLKETIPYLGYSSKVINTQPPEKTPEAPKISLSIKSESLNPLMPEYQNVYQILTQQGVKNLAPPVPEAMLNQPPLPGEGADGGGAPADLRHGGKLAQQESLSKHAADLTGGMPGTGRPRDVLPDIGGGIGQ